MDASGIKETIIQAIPNLSLRLQAANSVERFDMSLHQVTYHTLRPQQVVLAGRIGAKHVTKSRVNVWFVDGNPEIAEIVEMLHHDLCDFWITINEPNVYTALGYVLGSYPPGQHDLARAQRVIRNLVQAHVEAFYAIRDLQPEAQIGYCLDYRLFDPARVHSPLDRGLAWLHQTFFVWAT